MKKIFTVILACTLGIFFSGCSRPLITYLYSGGYTFINQSSHDVNFDIYASCDDGRLMNEKYIILRNESYTIYTTIPECPPVWLNYIPDDLFYTIISNGTVKVIQRPNEGLYNIENYKVILDIPNKEEYEYIITDDLFNDGTPIGEE